MESRNNGRSRDDHPRRVTAVLAFAGLSASLMSTLVIPIQPELPSILGVAKEATTWVVTVTLLAAAITMPISGRLGDLYGKRRVMLVLLAAMAVGSALCAISSDFALLIAGRALQGVALGTISLGISLLRDVLPPDRLGGGIALVSATLGVGGALGLPLSAVVVQYLDWHAIFWLSLALAVAVAVLVVAAVPPSVPSGSGGFDILGALGLATGLCAILLAISQGNVWGWGSLAILALELGGLIVLILWSVFEVRVESPLVDLRVLRRAPVLRTNIASIAMGIALFASSIAYPQLLQLPIASGVGLGLGILAASLAMMPSGLSMMAMSPVAARVISRTGARTALVLGALLLASSYTLALFFMTEAWQIVIAGVLGGMGAGIGYAAMPTLIMSAVPTGETAAANGVNAVMRTLGTTVGAAVFGSILATFATRAAAGSVPTAFGFRVVFGAAALSAVISAIVAVLIPRSMESEPTSRSTKEESGWA